MSSIVFDATALIHFSRAGRLRELQVSSTEDEAILLVNVSKELEQGGPLRPTLDPATVAWLKAADLTEMTELAALPATGRNWAAEPSEITEKLLSRMDLNKWGTAIIEEVARNIGQDDGLAIHGSLWLLARSFNDGILDRATTEGTISDLLSSGMRLPCKNGTDFIPWAQSVGLIPQN